MSLPAHNWNAWYVVQRVAAAARENPLLDLLSLDDHLLTTTAFDLSLLMRGRETSPLGVGNAYGLMIGPRHF